VTLDSAKKNLVADDNMQIAKQKVVKQKVAKQEKVIAKKKRSTDEKWQVKEIVKTAPQQSYASKKSTHNSRKKTDVKKALPTDAWTIQLGAFKKEKNINTFFLLSYFLLNYFLLSYLHIIICYKVFLSRV
jgi:septal ring-binding cell division protein DamX